MAEIINTYKQSVPAMRFIGRKYSDSYAWDEWYEKDLFGELERAVDGEKVIYNLYEDWDAYIGMLHLDNTFNTLEYWIGEFVAAGTQVPDGFLSIDYPARNFGVCWISGEHDKTAGVLQATHVREGDYFSSRVHRDIDAIMEDIREAHRGRSDSAPENNHSGRTQAGFGGSGELQGQSGGSTADGILQADKAALQQADRGRKTMANPDFLKSELAKSNVPQRGKKK